MKRILVVDDSEVNLLLLQSIFQDDPEVEIITEIDSTKAFGEICEILPDLLVLDLMMPHVDGYEILENVRNTPALKDLPVLVISAKQDEDSIKRAIVLNATEYIKKPIRLESVEQKIRSLLNALPIDH